MSVFSLFEMLQYFPAIPFIHIFKRFIHTIIHNCFLLTINLAVLVPILENKLVREVLFSSGQTCRIV